MKLISIIDILNSLKEKKKAEYFLGFKRVPGSYNECWKWDLNE